MRGAMEKKTAEWGAWGSAGEEKGSEEISQ